MNVTQRVKAILTASRDARNSDTELWIIYAQKSGMNLTPEQIRVLRDMPSSETIRRTRQKIQEQGELAADHAVNEARYQKYKQVRQSIVYENPEQLLEKQGYKVLEWGA